MDNYNNQNNHNNNNYTAQPVDYQPQTQVQQSNNTTQKQNTKAIVSLVMGILSVLCCNPLFAASIVGIIMGVKSRAEKPENNTMATVGIILSIVGIVFMIIAITVTVINILSNPSNFTYRYNYIGY